VAVEISFCVVNTNLRALLLRGLDAIAREREGLPFETEAIVLDNASEDGSAEAARGHATVTEVIALERRAGWSENVTTVLQRARGRHCMLLNEDAELRPGAVAALHEALTETPRAAIAATALFRPDGTQQPSAWRFPTPWTALLAALFLHRRTLVQSRGDSTREVDWAQSCAILIRREAIASVGYWDESFFVYSDEVDVQRRLRDAGWTTLYVPAAQAVHHEQLSTGTVPERRIVEFSRNRDRYMRKHHGPAAALAVRLLTAWAYAVRALAALVLADHDPRRYWRHVTATLRPGQGEGMREAAAEFNRRRSPAGA
jgi:N-acetylglucosaminyl-diphospho-decaprenol L-rhamnosyltransferase